MLEQDYSEFFEIRKKISAKLEKEFQAQYDNLECYIERWGVTRAYTVQGYVEVHNQKLVLRVFALRVKKDRRKKDNQFSYDRMEILTAVEDYDQALAYSCIISNMMGKKLTYYFDDEDYPRKGYLNWIPEYIHEYRLVKPYEFDEFYVINWTEKEIIKLKPELKYSQISTYDNPIMYAKAYKECNAIEMLRKCGFRLLMRDKRCKARLNKGDKTFMKLLYKFYELKDVNEGYNYYSSYFKKYGLDMKHQPYWRFRENLKCHLTSYRTSLRYYNPTGMQIDFKLDPLAQYLFKKDVKFNYYKDYLEMAKRVGHDIEDSYWRYPNNVQEAHNKVMEEQGNLIKLQSQLRFNMLAAVLEDLKKYNCTAPNGYEVFVTSDMDIIQKQCDTLYQCLIRNDYVLKEVMQEIILVFLWKDGEPKATAEVYYNGKIGQFYGDERDRTKCQATEEQKEALNYWLSQVKLEKKTCSREHTYFYKGFQKKTEDGRFYTSFGDTYFEIGKVYATPFDDETILKTGKACKASNKVFHFCETIEEISRHYNPTCYCLIEALGPVIECGGALLSNKIRIVREYTI